MEHSNASLGLLSLDEKHGNDLHIVQTHGWPEGQALVGSSLDSLPGWDALDNHIPDSPQLVKEGLQVALLSAAGVPLDSRQNLLNIPVFGPGGRMGLFQLVSPPGQCFNRHHIEDLAGVGFYVGAAIHNAALIDEIRRQRDSAELLYGIGLRLSRFLNLDKIIAYAVEQGNRVMESDLSWYLEWADNRSHSLRVAKVTGMEQGVFKEGDAILLNKNALKYLDTVKTESKDSYMMFPDIDLIDDDDRFCEHDVYEKFASLGIHSALIVPVGNSDDINGLLCTFSRKKAVFGEFDVQFIQRLANQLLIALNTAQHHLERKELALKEEREAMSNELHDNMAQVINGLSLELHALTKRVSALGRDDELQERLTHFSSLVADAKASIREEIFELRLPSNESFWLNLAHFIDAFERWHEMEISSDLPSEELEQPLRKQREVIRIVQEMLWNVRKHSGQNQVHISATLDPVKNLIRIEVVDGGGGATDEQLKRGQGIATMKSRALHLGGELTLSNATNKGLQVELEVPLVE